jgi:hypothetical protein
VKGPEIQRKGAAGQRERLVGMGVGSGWINSQRESLVWVWGHVEKCALAVAFDRVAYAYGRFSLLRPRRPASGDGFNPSDVTKHFGLGFGFGSG